MSCFTARTARHALRQPLSPLHDQSRKDKVPKDRIEDSPLPSPRRLAVRAELPERSVAVVSDSSFGGKALCLLWLSFASGCTDVLSFLEFGDVFTSAMTGNTALLAIAIGRGHLLAASRSLTALVGFALGVMLAVALRDLGGGARDPQRTLRRLLLVEIACLGASAALWSASGASLVGDVLYVVILLSAVSMGIQGVAARVIGSAGVSTIVFTSVLISIVMSLTAGFGRRTGAVAPPANIKTHLATFAAYALAGLLAGVMATYGVGLLVWLPMIAVVIALLSSHLSRQGERRAG
jgi:uncharacterized membrane protein YoaK (UPF0700 family)